MLRRSLPLDSDPDSYSLTSSAPEKGQLSSVPCVCLLQVILQRLDVDECSVTAARHHRFTVHLCACYDILSFP